MHRFSRNGRRMAKRFTDTDKWKRAWFCELPLKAKLAWYYLLDNCDHRGVWFKNFRKMSFELDFKVDEHDFIVWFGDKLRLFDGDKYFVPSFVEFQYGVLNPGNNAHKSIIELIETLKNLGPNEAQNSPSRGAQDKDTDKDKEYSLKEGVGENFKPDLESAYKTYPLKKGKAAGMKLAAKEIKTPADLENLKSAIARYSKNLRDSKTDSKFIKHFSTFMGEWKDWLDPLTGTSDIGTAKNYAAERDTDHQAEVDDMWKGG